MKSPAAITGIGLVTPAGIGRAANWAAVRDGRTTARGVDTLSTAPIGFASTVPDHFDADRILRRRVSRIYDRNTQLAVVAARAAVTEAGLTSSVRADARVGVVIGTGLGGVTTFEYNHERLLNGGPEAVKVGFLPKALGNMVSGHVSIDLGTTGPNMVVNTACASGASAIGVGLDMLRNNACDVVIAGGTEAPVTPIHVAGFHKLRALASQHRPSDASRPFDEDRDGFVIAEGAGVLVLESERHAAARGIKEHAKVAGYAATADAHHQTDPHPDGKGAREAIQRSCVDAGLTPGEVGHVNAHATSTPKGDMVEARALADLTPHAVVTSTKGVTGHTLGAAGAIEAAYTALALRHQTVPPVANLNRPCTEAKPLDLVAGHARRTRFGTALSNSFGFGGHNAVLAFTT